MARKTRKTQDASSDDDAPEVVSHSASKADAKRSQKALHSFEAEERARRKARNRTRDQKLKERARVTRGRKMDEKLKGVRFMDQELDGEDDGGSDEDGDSDVEARMLRAMRDAADEVASREEEEADESDEFNGFEQDDMASDREDSTDDEEMDEDDEDEEALQGAVHKSSTKTGYLADELFVAAFAPKNSIPAPKRTTESTEQQMVRKRRRKSTPHPKDLVIGGHIIRTLPRLSDPRSQATARSVPSARARRFMDQSLAMKGKKAFLKKKGWERRPVNIGAMKYQGAPHGFTRTTR